MLVVEVAQVTNQEVHLQEVVVVKVEELLVIEDQIRKTLQQIEVVVQAEQEVLTMLEQVVKVFVAPV